jgi:Tol biopolymer transport system component
VGVTVAFLSIGVAGGTAAYPGGNGKLLVAVGSDLYELSGTTFTPLVTGAGYEGAGYSADGLRIAYSRNCNLYVLDKSDMSTTQVTDATGWPGACYMQPSLSPDGMRVAFRRLTSTTGTTSGTGVYAVGVIDVDGSNEQTLKSPSVPDGSFSGFFHPRWSPTGGQIAFHGVDEYAPPNFGDVYIVNSDGSGLRNVTYQVDQGGLRSNTFADWAPDGCRLVFTSIAGVNTIRTDGTELQPISSPGGMAVWSPDGTAIAFATPSGGSSNDVFTVGVDGSNPTNLTNTPGASEVLWDWQADPPVPPPPPSSCDVDPDRDDDGVPDTFDADGGDGTSPAGLLQTDDTGLTFGTLTAGSLTSVTDVADPKGIRITAGADGATLTMCAQGFQVELDPSTSATITCGSISVEAVGDGSVKITIGNASVEFPPGTSGTVDTNGSGGVTVSNVVGTDVTLTIGGVEAPVPPGNSNVIEGGSGNSSITGTAGNDVIIDLGGNNAVDGKGGDDTIVVNGSGNNAVKGGAGHDHITTGSGNDAIDGGDGDDAIHAGDGNNTVKGGKGDDTLTTGSGNDAIDGGQGTDTCDPGGPPGKNSVKGCELP